MEPAVAKTKTVVGLACLDVYATKIDATVLDAETRWAWIAPPL